MKRTPPSSSKHSYIRKDVCTDNTENVTTRKQKTYKSPEDDETYRPHWVESFKEEIMDLLQSWKDEQDCTLRILRTDILELKKQTETIHKTNKDIEKNVEFISKQYDAIHVKVGEIERLNKDNNLYIKFLEYQIEHLEKNVHSSMIEIRNAPKKDSESIKDLSNIILKMCEMINVDINCSDIRDVYRINMNNYKNGPIVVQLSSSILRNRLLDSVKKYNKNHADNKLNSKLIGISNEKIPIYVSERLSQRINKLFITSKKFAKEQNFKFCWVNNSRIFLRKAEGYNPIRIREENDLNQLLLKS